MKLKTRYIKYVSIPFTSGNSFLHDLYFSYSSPNWLCQSPSRRGTHFYEGKIKETVGKHIECQSPSRRGTHFYRHRILYRWVCYLCQSPSHRGTHFYPKWKNIGFWAAGVNPLHIGELISTILMSIIIVAVRMCQSPSHRGTHFYSWEAGCWGWSC